MKSQISGVIAMVAENIATHQQALIKITEDRDRLDEEEVRIAEELQNLEVARRILQDMSAPS